jgi:hypothetical protein
LLGARTRGLVRFDEPLADVAALGGWKDITTLLACYITADPAMMKRALERRRMIEEARMESSKRNRRCTTRHEAS